MAKPRVAIFDFACCEGCQLQIVNMEAELVDLISVIEPVEWREAMSEQSEEYDIAIIEGSITRPEDAERLKQIREKRYFEPFLADGRRITLVGVAFAVALVAVIGLFGLQVFYEFPQFGVPAMERFADAPAQTYLATGAEATGAPNIVTAVLLDFRGWDTLGEGTVLFCAVLGATALMRKRARRKDDASG